MNRKGAELSFITKVFFIKLDELNLTLIMSM